MQVMESGIDGLKVLFVRGMLRQAGAPLMIGAVVLLLSAIVLLGVHVSTMRKNTEWVQQVDNILLQVADVDSGVIGDELSVRGYALTSDPRFLTYQRTNLQQAAHAMTEVSALIANDPAQAARFVELRRIVAKHSAYFSGLTRLGPGHAKDVAAAIVDDRYRSVMNDFRARLASFRIEELTLLAERQAAAAEQASHAYDTAVGIVLAAFLLGGLGIFVSQYGQHNAG